MKSLAIVSTPPRAPSLRPFKARQMVDKYRIRRRIADGAFATVYEAYDTIEGVPVALKVAHQQFFSPEMLDILRKEVRLTARMEHPNILPLRNATTVGEHFVIATPLGEQSLADRLRYRISAKTALSYTHQLLEALAYAHDERIIHCDIKPDNIILFPGGIVRLADFGIAKVALQTRTIQGSGQGTVGYIAPEQAMGRPSFRSDVFSMGLVLYRMFSGELPEWPFDWPGPGDHRLRRNLSRDFIRFLRRSIEVHERRRFRDGAEMLDEFEELSERALRKPRSRRALR